MPRANTNSRKRKVKLTSRKLGHVKYSYHRKPYEEEGKWQNGVIGKTVFQEEIIYRTFNFLYNTTYCLLKNQPYSLCA